jgi:ATP-dependent Clp protease adapter protein ClpS
LSTEVIEDTELITESIYRHLVILFNDNVNDFFHVENCLMDICKKTEEEAVKIAIEAHESGKAVCYNGSLEECETVGEKLAEQNLTVSVQ